MNSAHLREQVDQHLKTLCHRRLAKLDWKLSELAQHVYDTATPTESEVSMLRAILQREVAILGKKGIQIMVALGAKDLQLVWKDWPEVGTLTPSKIPDNPRASSITKLLGEQARNRIQILGFTQEHFAAKVSGAYTGAPLRPKVLANYLNGKVNILTPMGFQILDALGLSSIDIIWEES